MFADVTDLALKYWGWLHLFGTEKRRHSTHALHEESHARFPWAARLSPDSLIRASRGELEGLTYETIEHHPPGDETDTAALHPVYAQSPAPAGDVREAREYLAVVEGRARTIHSHPDVLSLVHRAIRDDDLILWGKHAGGVPFTIEIVIRFDGEERRSRRSFIVGPETPPRYLKEQIQAFLRAQQDIAWRLAEGMTSGVPMKRGGRPRRSWAIAVESLFLRSAEGLSWNEVGEQLGLFEAEEGTLRNYVQDGRRLLSLEDH